MTYRWLTDLHEIARSANLRVTEIEGWKTRGRPNSVGEFDPHGIVCHHTGGTGNGIDTARWIALTGRPDEGIPAPLAQLALNRDGIVYILAAGRANQAGEVEVRPAWIPDDDGNTWTIGIEAMNTGAEGWTDDQHDAYVRLCGALCDAYGWPAAHVVGHKEIAPHRKVDPGKLDMDRFRAAVARLTDGGPMPDDTPVWQRKIKRDDHPDEGQPDTLTAGEMLSQTHNRAGGARTAALEAKTQTTLAVTAAREARSETRATRDAVAAAATAAEGAEKAADSARSSAQVAARRAGDIIEMLGGRWVLQPDPAGEDTTSRVGQVEVPEQAQRSFGSEVLSVPEPETSMRPGEYRKATGAAVAAGGVGVLGALAQAWINGGLDQLDAEQVSTYAATIVTLVTGVFGVTFARANRTPAEIAARKTARRDRPRRRRRHG